MKKQNDLASRVRAELNRLIPKGTKRILCGFSGGADSSALLDLLHRYASERAETGAEPLTIYAAHVHHGIRGEEADADAAFCSDFCLQRGIVLFSVREDVPQYAKAHKIGTEEAARILRYRAFHRICHEQTIELIATAHNATDQLETVLMHLVRGSGLDGLCGIPASNRNIIRPMLPLTKEEILAYCADNHIPYVTDSTNADEAYTRNFLRARLLPLIRRINPRAEAAVCALTQSLSADRDYLDRLASVHSLAEGKAMLAALPDPILSRVIRRAHKESFPHAPMLTHLQCRAAMDAIHSSKSPLRITIPGGGELICDRDAVFLKDKNKEEDTPPAPIRLHEGWQTFACGAGIIFVCSGILTESDRQKISFFQNIYNLSNTTTLNSATMSNGVTVRARLPGDFYFDGRHTRNVRKLLQATALPTTLRARYPIFCDACGILWIPGFPVRDNLSEHDGNAVRVFCFFGKKDTDCP